MASDRWITIGVLQLRGHPAVIVGDCDYLEETAGHQPVGQLAALSRSIGEIEEARARIRQNYLAWAETRLLAVVDELVQSGGLPDVLVLPECSVPAQLLPGLRSRIKASGTVALAGTHTPAQTAEILAVYQRAGVSKTDRERLPPSAAAVLPVILPHGTKLHPKRTPSIFERVPHRRDSNTPLEVKRQQLKLREHTIEAALFVCAEAYQLPSYGDGYPDLAAIIAFDPMPQRFDSHINLLVGAGIPVILANDGNVGGSSIRITPDRRAVDWWHDSPFGGQLPAGDSYLEVRLNLEATNPKVGTTAPQQQYVLQKLWPLLYESESLRGLEEQAIAALVAHDLATADALLPAVREASATNPIVAQRLNLLRSFASKGRLDDDLLAVAGRSLCVHNLPSLQQLEASLSELMLDALERVQNAAETSDIGDENLGRVVKAHQQLRRSAGASPRRHIIAAAPIAGSSSSIGGEHDKTQVRNFALQDEVVALIVSGLEGIGKTVAIADGLAQSAVKTLRIQCVIGTSADYLFEALLRAAGRVPPGVAPRIDFSVRDLADALMATKVLWIEDAHNLTDRRQWRSTQLGKFFRALFDALKVATGVRVVVESRFRIEFDAGLGQRIQRLSVRGLHADDAVKLLERELHRVELAAAFTADEKAEIVRLVEGHPGMLALCAQVAVSDGARELLVQLRARKGFFLAAVEALVSRLQLGDDEKRILLALLDCRRPVPTAALDGLSIEGGCGVPLRHLLDAGLVVRVADDIGISWLLRESASALGSLETARRTAFHRQAANAYDEKVRTTPGVAAYVAALEANYHAIQAGDKPPFDPGGLLDSLVGAATKRFQADEYEAVVNLLAPVRAAAKPALHSVREEVWNLLARAYAWSNRFDDAFEVATELTTASPSRGEIFLDIGQAAMRARRYPDVRRALDHALKQTGNTAGTSLLAGRLHESENRDYASAARCFREAVHIDAGDGWAYFYLARSLIRIGEFDDALNMLARACELNERRHGRGARRLEQALLSQQMRALALTGAYREAETIARLLSQSPDAEPEVLVYAAYVQAASNGGASKPNLEHFDAAIERLQRTNPRAAHARAEVALFRGKLLEHRNQHAEAEQAYAQACHDDPHNIHMKICHARALGRLLTNAAGSKRDQLRDTLDDVESAISSSRARSRP